jgi:hypothetical protein
MRWTVLAVVLVAAATSACASVVYITYHSDPEGAMVYVNSAQQFAGYTPVRLSYNHPAFADDECAYLRGVKVRWASGATAAVPSLIACPMKGRNQQLVFHRPPEAPGAGLDAQFAALRQLNDATLQQVAIQAAWAAVPPPPRQTHCTSQVIGTQVFTNCY